MTKRQVISLIILGLATCVALACVSFLYLNSVLFSSSNVSVSPITPGLPLTTESSEMPTQTPVTHISLEDGIYIVGNSDIYQTIPAINDDSVLDISTLLTTSNKRPVFAVKGNGFPIEELKLRGYYAGIGVNAELVSFGMGKLGAKITHVFENSPAEEAGLEVGEIIFGINGGPFQAIHLNFGFPPYNDLVDIINPNQNEITIEVLSGTTERDVTLSRAYRLSGDNFKTNRPISSFTFEPNGDYVLLKVTWPLESGIYRLEFEQDETQKWIFIVP